MQLGLLLQHERLGIQNCAGPHLHASLLSRDHDHEHLLAQASFRCCSPELWEHDGNLSFGASLAKAHGKTQHMRQGFSKDTSMKEPDSLSVIFWDKEAAMIFCDSTSRKSLQQVNDI